MEAYSLDLRKRVVRAYDQKIGSQHQIAELFGVSLSWVEKLLRRRRQTGLIQSLPHGGGPQAIFDPTKLKLLGEQVEADPDATLAQLRDRLDLKVSLSVIHRALVKLGWTYKKKRYVPPSKTART